MAYGNYAPFYRPGFFNPMQPQTMPQYQQMQDNGNQFIQQYQPNLQPTQMSLTNDFLWVLNENEATAYPVAPGANVVLWDKNSPTIYVKSVNAQGVPSMRILDFSERTADNTPKTSIDHVCECHGKYVTIDAFNSLQERFDALKRELEEMQTSKAVKTKKTLEVDDNE